MSENNTTTATPTAPTVEGLRAITAQIEALEDQRREIGRALPPITFKDVCPDGHNVESTFERDVSRFLQDRMKEIDVTMLDTNDPDKWEFLTPRYAVGELEPTGIDEDDRDVQPVQYGVIDLDNERFVEYEDNEGKPLAFDDKSDAQERCYELNSEDDENRHGFPFACNTGFVVENERWIDDLRACGFLVYRYDGDKLIAGIDGGGYSFMGAHFAPFYARLAARNGWLVETKDGPRRMG